MESHDAQLPNDGKQSQLKQPIQKQILQISVLSEPHR